MALSRVHDADSAAAWMASYNQWERDFAGFLGEKSEYRDGTVADQHARLVKARRMIRRRIKEGHLFTFLRPPEGCSTPIPPTNNLIESWNAGIRDMLRRHRGLGLLRRIKAICWWCHSRTEHPETAAWLVRNAITDQGSRSSTGTRGNQARRAHGRPTASPRDTAPASTGTNSTPPRDTPTPPTDNENQSKTPQKFL